MFRSPRKGRSRKPTSPWLARSQRSFDRSNGSALTLFPASDVAEDNDCRLCRIHNWS